ncbi:unnamed protein product [Polarella glacialis]|uniref:Uncharacterized protein n=1 Tax=Polarella glacialis TaxID=89957 RepID=A0A813J8F1_POLGL|nr:unnamed protein product [Polarella glacialis]CAE8676030.1 unnamed protein product [Polarella glacialis]
MASGAGGCRCSCESRFSSSSSSCRSRACWQRDVRRDSLPLTLGRRQHWRPLHALLLALLAVWCGSACFVSSQSAGGFGVGVEPMRRVLLPQRHFFKGSFLDPVGYQRDAHVCESLDNWLPNPPRKTKLLAMELEPVNSRYWSFLKPTECRWILDKFVVFGREIDQLDEKVTGEFRASAGGLGAKLMEVTWKKAGLPTQFGKTGIIDMGLISDGTMARLARERSGVAGVEASLRKMHQALKTTGRFYFVADEEDEKALGGTFLGALDVGFEAAVLKRIGFEVVASSRNHGLVVGYMVKTNSPEARVVRKEI